MSILDVDINERERLLASFDRLITTTLEDCFGKTILLIVEADSSTVIFWADLCVLDDRYNIIDHRCFEFPYIVQVPWKDRKEAHRTNKSELSKIFMEKLNEMNAPADHATVRNLQMKGVSR